MHTVKWLQAESVIWSCTILYRYGEEKIDQSQLQWHLGQFYVPRPGRLLGLTEHYYIYILNCRYNSVIVKINFMVHYSYIIVNRSEFLISTAALEKQFK